VTADLTGDVRGPVSGAAVHAERPGGPPARPDRPGRGTHLARLGARVAAPALALLGGVLVALSLPPWGFWPLSFVGVMVFALSLGDAPGRGARFARGMLFGAGWMFVGMGWMVQLTVAGYLAAAVAFASWHGVAAAAAPTGRGRVPGRAAAHTLVEALRFSFPFGGVPLASLGIAQVAGPFAGVVRVGGVILLTFVVFLVGFATADLVEAAVRARGRAGAAASRDADVTGTPEGIPPAGPTHPVPAIRPALTALALVPVIVLVGLVAPRGAATGEVLRVAAVQGGGEQGTSAVDVPSQLVTERHLAATAAIEPDPALDLVLWPENTIDVADFADSDVRARVAAEAARLGVPLAVGVTEDTPDGRRFLNVQVVIDPDGEIVSRYEKVRRVPFGEYVPLRDLLTAVGAPIDRIGRDAVPGTGPAYVELADGTRLATVISWEVFFGGRARDGVDAGGAAIINPTNGASYTGTIVQTQQVASSRLRAIETGRWVVQAAPTGFTAFLDDGGYVLDRSAVGEQRVMIGDVELRDGTTWYVRLGDAPVILFVVAVFAGAWWLDRRDRRLSAPARRPRPGA
jgi:apolipoprotein N-acyltransferase